MLILVLLLMMFGVTAAQQDTVLTNEDCFRCHESETLSLLDKETMVLKSFHVDPHDFANSNHKDLKCITCHDEGFNSWPHEAVDVKLTCLDCHSENSSFVKNNPEYRNKFEGIPAKNIYEEFEKSVHFQRHSDDFDCFSCHDPHSFDRKEIPSEEKIAADNQMCFNCHQTDGNSKTKMIDADVPPVDFAHEWLPERELHWNKVRCIDCHTSYEGKNLSHNIMPKEDAVRKCESCHSQNSILMTKLYKYESKESKEKYGFVNGALLNDAYVIGSTRNELMINASYLIFGLAFLGMFVHGLLRYLSNKKENEDNE